MAVRDEMRILVNPNGVAELQCDRVKDVAGAEARRMKLTRHPFEASLLSAGQDHLAVLPSECVFVHEGMNGRKVYVIEQPPCVRPVVWNSIQPEVIHRLMRRGCVAKFSLNPDKIHTDRIFRLAFPYVVFIVNTLDDQIEDTNVLLYFRTEPLRSWNDDLSLPSVPNFNSTNHNICWGSGHRLFGRDGGTLAKQINEMVHAFWNTPFNDHWLETYDRYAGLVSELCTPWHWQYYSLRNSLFVLGVDWIASGKTPGSFIDGGDKQKGKNLFQVFVNAAQGAPVYVEGMDDERLIVSPSPDIFFQGMLISILDTFVATGDAAPFKSGDAYHIKHFFEPKKDPDQRMVQLVEITEPIRLEILLASTKKVVDESVQQKFTFNGVEVRVGNYIEFDRDAERPPQIQHGQIILIEGIRIDMDGDLEVCSGNKWFYITTDQGTNLRAGYRVTKIKVKAGVFSFSGQMVCEGETINLTYCADRLGQVFFDTGAFRSEWEADLTQKTLRITKLFVEEKPFGVVVFARFRGMDQDIPFFCNGTFLAEWKTVSVLCNEREVQFGAKKLALSNGCALLAKDERRVDGQVYLYTPVRFVNRTTDADTGEQIDLEIAFGNAPIPVVKDGKWVWGDDYAIVQTHVGDDTLFLKTGSVLRIDQAIDGAEIGSLLQVLCFDAAKKEILFSDGRYTTFSDGFLDRVSVKQVDGSYKNFSKANASTLSFVRSKKTKDGEMFVKGEECLFVGPNREYQNQVMVVGSVYACGDHYHIDLFLKDGKHFGEVNTSDNAVQKIDPMRLWHKWPSTDQTRNYTDGTKTFQISEEMFGRQLELKTRKVIGNGTDGKPISIGDIVLVAKRSWGFYENGGMPEDSVGVFPALVAASSITSDGRTPFLFLWFGKKMCTFNHTNILGYDLLPQWLREDFRAGKVGANLARDCYALTMISDPPKPVEEKGISEKPVRIKTDVELVYGRGNVLPDERGFLVECENGEVVVRFPNDPEWMGKKTEIEIALLAGDTVRMKKGIETPIFLGTLPKQEQVGTIREVHGNTLCIDWPEWKGWYASVNEIEFVP